MNLVKFLPLTALLLLTACDTTKNIEIASEPINQSTAVELTSQAQKISYLMGLDNGNNIKSMDIEFDAGAFQNGIETALRGDKPSLSDEQIAEVIKSFEIEMKAKQETMVAEQQKSVSAQSDSNAAEALAFLTANGTKEGVVTTDTGLQYRVLIEGDGAQPSVESTVEVHYAGRLLDGTEFDSSVKRGVPAQFGVTQVIAGWTEALQLMPEGSKWELYIPADLAYGPGGSGPIGPNSLLIFEVELLQANIVSE
jgi:FKBP-type peptidyl-prolyl cis-trans isomerase